MPWKRTVQWPPCPLCPMTRFIFIVSKILTRTRLLERSTSPFTKLFSKCPQCLSFDFRSKNGKKRDCVTKRYRWPIETKFGGYRVGEMIDLKYKILDSGWSWWQLKICYGRNEETQILYNEEQRSRRVEFGTFRKRMQRLETTTLGSCEVKFENQRKRQR